MKKPNVIVICLFAGLVSAVVISLFLIGIIGAYNILWFGPGVLGLAMSRKATHSTIPLQLTVTACGLMAIIEVVFAGVLLYQYGPPNILRFW